MKSNIFKISVLLCIALCQIGCTRYDEQTPDDFYGQGDFLIKLDAEKIPGQGQYRKALESSDVLQTLVHVDAPENLSKLEVTKTVNLEVDPSFANQGVLLVEAAGTNFDYTFTYEPSIDDVDQLVGFTFRAYTASGRMHTSDLTASITLSPVDNLPTKKWIWSSIRHVNSENQPNEEVIAECEKDNSFLFNADGTMSLQYGTDTGAGSCAFDGLSVYSNWYITEDEQYFVMEKYNVFTPDVIEEERYRVVTLSVDKLELELTVDLSALGLREEEVFLYIFKPTSKEN